MFLFYEYSCPHSFSSFYQVILICGDKKANEGMIPLTIEIPLTKSSPDEHLLTSVDVDYSSCGGLVPVPSMRVRGGLGDFHIVNDDVHVFLMVLTGTHDRDLCNPGNRLIYE